jgi:tape measure domain-containing protein
LAVKKAADLETLETSFVSLTGSAENARKTVKQLTDFTASTPFQLEGVANAGRQIIAAQGDTRALNEQLKVLGDIAATAQVPIDELASIYTKAFNKGKVQAEELNQISERGIPIIKALAEQFGVSTNEVFKLGSEGKIQFEDLQEAFVGFAQEGGFAFDAMARQSQTVNGLLSTLKDNVGLALAELGNEISEAIDLRGLIADITSFIQRATSAFANLDPGVKQLILTIGGIAIAIGPMLFALGKVIAIAPVVGTAITAMTGPVGIAIAAIAAGAALIIANWDTISEYFTTGPGAQTFEKLKTTVSTAVEAVKQVFSVGVALIQQVWETFGDNILESVTIQLNLVLDVFKFLFDQVLNLVDFWSAVFQGNWQGAFDAAKSIVATSMNFIVDIISSAVQLVINLADRINIAFGGTSFGESVNAEIEAFSERIKISTSETDKQTASLGGLTEMFEKVQTASNSLDLSNIFGTASGSGSGSGVGAPRLEAPEALTSLGIGNIDNGVDGPELAELDPESNPMVQVLQRVQEEAVNTQSTIQDVATSLESDLTQVFDSISDGPDAFLKSMEKLTISLIKLFLNQALGGVIAQSFATAPPPVAAGIAVAGRSLVNGLFGAIALAEGGITTGPTFALIGDNPSGKEAVIPFEKMPQFLKMAGAGSNNVNVTGQLIASGTDLIAVIQNTEELQGLTT